MKQKVVIAYVIMIFVFAIYGVWWGDYAFKGFAFNFGRALIWPLTMLPGLGKAVGVLLLLGFIGLVTLKKAK